MPNAKVSPSIHVVGTFALSESGCGYEGSEKVSAGRASITLSNATGDRAQFDFWKLRQGHSYQELAAHIGEEQRRGEAGEPALGHPAFATLISSDVLEPRAIENRLLEVDSGVYGMACIRLELSSDTPVAIYAAGPVEA